MRTISDAVEMERAMGCEAQEARQTTETELQEVSAELNQLLETGSDGSDIGRNPCPRLGYHIVATRSCRVSCRISGAMPTRARCGCGCPAPTHRWRS